MKSGFYGFEILKFNIMTKEQIEQMAIEYDRNLKTHPMSAGELRKDLVNFAMQVVKNCSIPDVVGQSEQFTNICSGCGGDKSKPIMCANSQCPNRGIQGY